MILYRIVFALIIITCVKSVVILQVEPDFKVCNTVTYLDLSDVDIIPVNDSLTVLNGAIGILKNISGPIRVTLRTERLNRGQWVPGEYNRFIKDFCKVMHDEDEAWTKITSQFKNQKCPFKAGTNERFKMEPIVDMGIKLPKTLVGKWRGFMDVASNNTYLLCLIVQFEFVDSKSK